MRRARLAALLLGVAVVATSCGGPPAALPAGAVPVLFVHGYGAGAEVFGDMIEHLGRRGYPPAYLKAVELVPADGSNIDAASRELAPAVEELIAAAAAGPNTKIDIVAHSMGALSSRWYATKMAPGRVRTLLTVGGANHGTDQLCGYDTAGGFDLCPAFATDEAHAAQLGLNGRADAPADETPFGRAADAPGTPSTPPDATRAIRYLAVLIPDDQWIRPLDSSRLAGADPVPALPPGVAVVQTEPGNLLFEEPTDHDAILQNDRLFVLLDSLLTGAGAR